MELSWGRDRKDYETPGCSLKWGQDSNGLSLWFIMTPWYPHSVAYEKGLYSNTIILIPHYFLAYRVCCCIWGVDGYWIRFGSIVVMAMHGKLNGMQLNPNRNMVLLSITVIVLFKNRAAITNHQCPFASGSF